MTAHRKGDIVFDENGKPLLLKENLNVNGPITQALRDRLLTTGGAQGVEQYQTHETKAAENEKLLMDNLHKLPDVVHAAVRLGHADKLAIVVHNRSPNGWTIGGELWVAELRSTFSHGPGGPGTNSYVVRTWRPRWKLEDEVGAQEHNGWEGIASRRGMVYLNSNALGFEDRIEW